MYRPTYPSLFLQPERGTSARHIEAVSEVNMTYAVAMVIGSENMLALTFSKQMEVYINSIFSPSDFNDEFSL